MSIKGIEDFDLCIESFVKGKSISMNKGKCYAVAGDRVTDIFTDWG